MTDPSQSPSVAEASLPNPKEDLLFGRIVLHFKLITKDQLVEALRQQSQEGDGRKVGNILVEKGYLTEQQLQQLLQAQQQIQAQQEAAKAAAPSPPETPGSAEGAPASLAVPAPAPEAPPSVIGLPPPAPPTTPVAEPPPPPPVATAAQAPAKIDEYLRLAVDRQASDLHLHAAIPIRLRIHGDFVEDPSRGVLSPEQTSALISGVLQPEQRERLEQSGQVDFSYTLPGVARFRANAYRQQNGVDAVFRVIPLEPPTLSELGLPLDLARFANYHQGMVLITGPAGCGKSSTLAALIRLINEERRNHIITIEDPIEYLHPSRRCIVNQRQVERHTETFARALRAALREDPDVIVIGELRDLETISLALSAAETGHLVLATLHTTNAISTINRVVGSFPPSQQAQVRTMCSESLRGVISQRLIKKREGGRVPALEILACTTAVGNLIRESKTFQIRSVLQTGGAQGMCLLDSSLKTLVADGVVVREEALRYCENPKILGGA